VVMLKRRVMIGLSFDCGVLTRTKWFRPDYRYTQGFLAVEAIDEAILVDVSRSGASVASREAMRGFAERCFAPVTFGGHLSDMAGVSEMFALGADKVVLGRSALASADFPSRVAEKWGSQAVVVACDISAGRVVSAADGVVWPYSAVEWAVEAERRGAGEIFLQSRERDGSLGGFPVAELREVAAAVKVPVVVGTGCGGWRHMADAFDAGADGCVTANVHHWTEGALAGFKGRLSGAGVAVRVAA